MIEIKKVDESDFYILQQLHRKMCTAIDSTLTNSKCAYSLIAELNYKDSCAMGLYKNNILVGFTLGYGISEDTYYFSSIYIEPKYRVHVLKLLIVTESSIPAVYTSWETDSRTIKGVKVLTKFGANAYKVIYKKDL